MKAASLKARFFGHFSRVKLEAKPLAEPEAVNAVERPMTGFFATLTAEQKKKALSYRGDEEFGSTEFLRAKTT